MGLIRQSNRLASTASIRVWRLNPFLFYFYSFFAHDNLVSASGLGLDLFGDIRIQRPLIKSSIYA